MRRLPIRLAIIIVVLAVAPLAARAQQATVKAQGKEKKAKSDSARSPKEAAPLFRADAPIEFTLVANFGRLKKDKNENAPWRSATLSYADSAGQRVEVPVRLRTRGVWRLKNCDFPPLRMDFAKADAKRSIFAKLDKPKLVTHCKDTDAYDQHLLQEAQLYRVYALLTPLAFRARVARVTYVDSANGKPMASRYAIVTEDVAELAQRTGTAEVTHKGALPHDLEPSQSALFGMFQYFAGNTDFAIGALHNVRLVTDDNGVYALPYDFDWTGVVNLPIARPDPQLGTRHVTQRLYRGFCVGPDEVQQAMDTFVTHKDAIYALYRDDLGKLIAPSGVKTTLSYYDEFYRAISDPVKMKRTVRETCVGRQ